MKDGKVGNHRLVNMTDYLEQDPIDRFKIDEAELFAHAPVEFEVRPMKLSWEDPCWICADISLCPRTPALREKFILNMKLSHRLDAYARKPWANQLWAAFAPQLSKIGGPYHNQWLMELLACHDEMKKELAATDSLFPQPFRFIRRQEFTKVDLSVILKAAPESLNVYLALEKGRYCEYFFLRIHSCPPHIGVSPKCSWYEKRLPDTLHSEDVVPWFTATTNRLPKKHRPTDVQPWINRLLRFEPQLASTGSGANKPWQEKPKIIMVFGPVGKVGYKGLTHFERRDVSLIVRRNDIVKLEGKTRHLMRDSKVIEIDRTFYLLAFDEAAAERVERQMMLGERIHFGLDADIFGMVLRSGHWLHAINFPTEMVRRHCLKPGEDISLTSNPRDKYQTFELVRVGDQLGAKSS